MLLRQREGLPFPYPSVRALDLSGCAHLAEAGAPAGLAQLCRLLPCLTNLNLRGCSCWVNAEGEQCVRDVTAARAQPATTIEVAPQSMSNLPVPASMRAHRWREKGLWLGASTRAVARALPRCPLTHPHAMHARSAQGPPGSGAQAGLPGPIGLPRHG